MSEQPTYAEIVLAWWHNTPHGDIGQLISMLSVREAQRDAEHECPQCAAKARVMKLFDEKWGKEPPDVVSVAEITEAYYGGPRP